jgi:hypothetical protein
MAARGRRTEHRRAEAARHREQAQAAKLAAERSAAAADEQAARARREQLEAQEHARTADEKFAEVRDLENRADEIDPDVAADADETPEARSSR